MDTRFNVFEVLQIAEEIEHKAARFYLRAADERSEALPARWWLRSDGRRGSTIRAAGFVDVDFAPGLGDDIDGIGDLGQVRDSEQSKAFATTQPAVSRAAVKVPAIPAARTFGDYVHPITSSFSCHVVVVQLSIFVKVTKKL